MLNSKSFHFHHDSDLSMRCVIQTTSFMLQHNINCSFLNHSFFVFAFLINRTNYHMESRLNLLVSCIFNKCMQRTSISSQMQKKGAIIVSLFVLPVSTHHVLLLRTLLSVSFGGIHIFFSEKNWQVYMKESSLKKIHLRAFFTFLPPQRSDRKKQSPAANLVLYERIHTFKKVLTIHS